MQLPKALRLLPFARGAQAVLPQSAQQLAQWLLQRAIHGLPPLLGAGALAQQYRSDLAFPHDEARLAAMVRWEVGKSFTAGFVSSLAGVIVLPVSVPANLGAVWLLQARLAATVAALRGYDLHDAHTGALMLLSLTGAAAPEVLRQAGVRASQWAATRAVLQLSEAHLLAFNRRVGLRLLSTASQRGALRLSRLVPVVGAAVGGAFDAYAARAVARTAQRLFSPPLLLGPASVPSEHES